ncbi:MAG: serine/threonine protein kinase [Ruminococcus sp.]|uniref:serine/threonine-protein kinase n=1 Tax=Ruminococcus sp. TaxID=41978 RepID=UPI0025E0CD0F|nr:serine/threonine-protein kinase [Ruminococcus sp.]MCR4794167.1 serine/threonine protein kinase [Ruminococcus sp.]
MLNKGFVLENRYKIVNVAGKGGTSVVYRAVDLKANNAQRAVKEVMKTNGTDAYNARQESLLIKEFYEKDAKNSFFPNIIEIIDNDPDALYIVQDYINGVSMDSLLAYGPFRHKTMLRYSKDICRVMSFIHKCGLIHSDMKPDNIMVVRNEEDFENSRRPDKFGRLKFIDFGSVIERRSGAFAYTPAYASPEQFYEQELDEQTDIFNIGATMYHMLTGKKPKNVSSNGEFVSSAERFVFDKGTNAGLVRIIRKCVNEDKTKRYRSCDELYEELERTDNHTYLRAASIIAGFAALCLGVSLFANIMANKSRNEDFNKLVERAENTGEYSARSEAFEEVIKADGSYADAYLKLIEIYKNDMVFDAKEAEQILALINENINQLKEAPEFEEIAYELGILYWYYYFYGNEGNNADQNGSISGKIASVKWFREAQTSEFKRSEPDKYEIAQVYCTIGDFYSQTQKKENELLKKNYSEDLWKSMNELNKLVEEANAGSEIIILETYKTLLNLENSNMSDFAKSGITYEEQRAFLDDIKTKTDKLGAADDSAAVAKEYILNYYDRVIESIEGSE